MFDIEDEINLDDVKLESLELYLVEGVCGGDLFGRSFFFRSDNFSLEVQFEEESFRYLSEISILFYQNFLEEGEGSGVVLFRQESEDSIDFIFSDFVDFFKEVVLSCDIKDLFCVISLKCKQDACEEFVRSERCDIMVIKDELDCISRQLVVKGESESSFFLSREGKVEGL